MIVPNYVKIKLCILAFKGIMPESIYIIIWLGLMYKKIKICFLFLLHEDLFSQYTSILLVKLLLSHEQFSITYDQFLSLAYNP